MKLRMRHFQWRALSFKRQLTLTLVGVAFFAQAILAVGVYFKARTILVERAMDLLTARNAAALKQFQSKTEMLASTVASCDMAAAKLLTELRESRHFLGIAEGAAPSGSIHFRGDLAEIEIGFECAQTSGKPIRIRMDTRWLSSLFTDRSGLGESGEVYLMTASGSLLTESRFLKNPQPAPVPAGFQEDWRGQKPDYRGIPVFGVWKKVSWGGFTGIVASEIDVAEVYQPIKSIWSYLLLFQGFSLLVIVLSAGVLAARLSGKTEREAELQKVRRQSLIEGQERERNWIGLELHDDISQEVAALNWRLSTYDLTPAQIEPLRKSIDRILGKIRFLAHGLLTNVVSTSGLPDSIRNLLSENKDAAMAHGLNIELAIEGEESAYEKLSDRYTVGVYRILQEAIHNIFKHSKATTARVHLKLDPDTGLQVSVEDNGHGLKNAKKPWESGHGMKNMQSRAEALRGRIRIDSPARGGFRVEANFDRENLI